MVAAVLGGGLLPAARYGWERLFARQLGDWAQGTRATVVGAVVLIPTVWVVTLPILRLTNRRMPAKPQANRNKLVIYVAQFGNDEASEAARTRVIDSIRKELNPNAVEVLRAEVLLNLTEGASFDEAADHTSAEAHRLLSRNQGDLLIWGRVHTIGEGAVIELRFVSAVRDGREGGRIGFTGTLRLEPGFGAEVGAAAAAIAATLAVPTVENSGKYLAETLLPIATRLAHLIAPLPASMRGDDRAAMLLSYALVESTLGEQLDESKRLEEAVAAYRGALKEYTRERAP